MLFPTNDKYWDKTRKFLEKHANKSDDVLAPGEFQEFFPKVYYYTSTTIGPSFFKNTKVKWAVIHKGMLPFIGSAALKEIVNHFIPVFANEVFVVFSRQKVLPALKPYSPHLISLYAKMGGTKLLALLKIKKILKRLLRGSSQHHQDDVFETEGELTRSKDGYLWVRRNSSAYRGMNQDEIGINFKHENHILGYISKLSGKNKVFIDVGAHVGFFSIRLSKKFKKVYAIEPNPSNLQALKINAILNNLSNITLLDKGCWNKAKQDKIYDRGGESFLKNSLSRTTKDKEHTVSLVTLDSIASKIKEPMVIKIDTEGAELPILRGADNLLKKGNVAWIIEHHEYAYHDLKGRRQEIISFMSDYGYELINFDDASKLIFTKK